MILRIDVSTNSREYCANDITDRCEYEQSGILCE